MRKFQIISRQGKVVCDVVAFPHGYNGDRGELFRVRSSSFEIEIEKYGTLLLQPVFDSVWRFRCDDLRNLSEYIELEEFPPPKPIDWYHQAMGFELIELQPTDGRSQIRIGVVDSELGTVAGLEHVESVRKIEVDEPLPHAELIIRLLANRMQDRRLGLVPWARVAHFPAISENPRHQSPHVAHEGILELTDWGADIINLSFGWRSPHPFIRRVIRNAVDYATTNGVTVVAASGNASQFGDRHAPIPAAFEDVITVGGLGDFNAKLRPPSSYAYHESDHESRSRWIDHPVLGRVLVSCMRSGMFHPSVNCVAPSVGIIVDCDSKTSREAIGTSFAAPLVTGWLADRLSTDYVYSTLPRSRARLERSFALLEEGCVALVGLDEPVGFGLPCLRTNPNGHRGLANNPLTFGNSHLS